MTGERCEGCGRSVPVAGGIANVWTLSGSRTGGMTLELADGTEHFLCFECLDDLSDEPDEAEVATLPKTPREDAVSTGVDDGAGISGVGAGLALGAVAGGVAATATGGQLEPLLATGAAAGVGAALLARRLGERD